MKKDNDTGFPGCDATFDYRLSRREFLGLTGSGIFLFFTIGELPAFAQQEPARRPGLNLPTDFNAFLRIGPDGRVACFTGKIEMGQGVHTSLAQMLADELDVSIDAVDMVMGDTDLCPWDMGTFGSMSTRFFGPALRAAGAEARGVLLDMAAEQLKTPAADLIVEQGVIIDGKNRQRTVTYGQLAQGKTIERHLTGKVAVKSPATFKVMAKPLTRRDARQKVTGEAKYAGDIRVPGMLYAKILRPPAHGARLLEVDLTEAGRVNGVQIVRDADFIAVLHKYPDVAELGRSKIKAKFDTPPAAVDDQTIFDHLLKAAPEPAVLAKDGDLEKGGRDAVIFSEQTYLNDYVAHAQMEPHTALVSIEGNKATVWASTQTPFSVKEEVAKELGIPSKDVRVMPVFVGGGFGGKSRNLQVVEAARCARLSDKPVQVGWTREEAFFDDSFRPAAVVKIKSGVTDKGRLSFWDYQVYFAGDRGAAQFYAVPNHRTLSYGASRELPANGAHPFAVGPWRAPGNNTNTFARESQIDIMAAAAGIDPLAFRLQNLTDPKMQRVLQAAADKFGWKAAKAPSARGVGIACATDAGSYVATMAEVEVDRAGGEIRVKRVVCAQDMGLAVNPEGAAIQIEGCINMGLGYALKERIRFKGGDVLDRNFDTYELPRFSWMPKIETLIIDDKDAPPQGGGEPAIVTMGAVIANAVYDAVGVRMLQLPMTPERVKKALKG